MINVQEIVHGFKTPESRWARFGPYYAMFPLEFAFDVVEHYSNQNDYIIDPFAGRGSSVFAGGVLGRHSLGIEINPVGWLYGYVKLHPASKFKVVNRLLEIYKKRNYFSKTVEGMPLFFRMCYCDEVLKFLLTARKHLKWDSNITDATLMSILLVYLHGKIGEGLSNQMRMTKAMGINYSIKWWKSKKLTTPPEINPIDFVTKKLNWRYKKGKPLVFDSNVILGDSTIEIDRIIQRAQKTDIRFSLLFTSPPYCAVTDYFTDQWLRRWMLGGPTFPKSKQEKYKGRFISRDDYYNLLNTVFGNCAVLMKKKSTIYVRTDTREFTFNSTLEILQHHFPKHKTKITDRPFRKKTQTDIMGNSSLASGERDIILTA